jgi:hypothetical protein
MKWKSGGEKINELRPVYNLRELLKGGVQAKYADCFREGANLLLLDQDVAEAFPTEKLQGIRIGISSDKRFDHLTLCKHNRHYLFQVGFRGWLQVLLAPDMLVVRIGLQFGMVRGIIPPRFQCPIRRLFILSN